MTYDCRKEGREEGSASFPCNVRILGLSGEKIDNVFYARTSPPLIGRFVTGPDGTPLAGPERKKRWHVKPDGSKRVEYYYDRLECWYRIPWVAVAVDGGGIVARSDDGENEANAVRAADDRIPSETADR